MCFWQSSKFEPFLHPFDFYFFKFKTVQCHKLFVLFCLSLLAVVLTRFEVVGFLSYLTKDLLISPILWVELIVICLAERYYAVWAN